MRRIECTDLYQGSEVIDNIDVDVYPDTCPICHYSIEPEFLMGYRTSSEQIEVTFKCTRHDCSRVFIGYYHSPMNSPGWEYMFCLPKTHKKREFPKEVSEISPFFEEIFNEALKAETERLNHVAGMGYRKSLEFLIKDYLINYEGLDREEIERKFLGKCINEHIEHYEIKELAKRAAWLGNDESHFVRKWEDKSVEDLKTLIELVVSWIHQLVLSKKLIESIPEL